jgi:hypothetical protein
MRRWQHVIIAGIFLGAFLAIFHAQTLQQTIAQEPPDRAETVAIITTPTEGGVISGTIQIRGSASHPSAFDYFQLEYANLNNPTPIWLPITPQIRQQALTEEILGVWETVNTGVADGLYQIRLRVFLNDANIEPVTFIVTNLQLVNTQPTPIPTVSGGDAAAQPTSDEAPIIQQPPTRTPRPATPIPDTTSSADNVLAAAPASESDGGSSINFGRLQGAFCTGTVISLVLFGLLIGYMALRTRLRPVTRQLMWQIRNEMEDDR